MPQKVVCDDSPGDEPVLKKAEMTKKPKTNRDEKLIQAADEKWAPCTSWLPGLGWYRSAVTSSVGTSPRKQGILLEREGLGQQKMHSLELGWLGHWSVWCSCACLPTSSDSTSYSSGCALCPSSLGLRIGKALTSVSLQVCYCQGKILQGKQLLTVSPGAPASPRAPFCPFVPCAEGRKIPAD